MIITEYARDLFMTGAIFGVAAFVWAGWAQERPPTHWIWRVVLAILGIGGIALAAISIPAVIRNWTGPTSIAFGGTASTIYFIVVGIEIVAMIALAIWASRKKRSDLIAPFVLAVVGIHFIPLAFVFGQPIFALTGVLITIAAVIAALVPLKAAARSFWCGILGAPVLLLIGAICTAVAFGTSNG